MILQVTFNRSDTIIEISDSFEGQTKDLNALLNGYAKHNFSEQSFGDRNNKGIWVLHSPVDGWRIITTS